MGSPGRPRHPRRAALAHRTCRPGARQRRGPAASLGTSGISGIPDQPVRVIRGKLDRAHHRMEWETVMVTVATAGKPVLELTGIGKEFGAIRALHDVDMQ